MKKIMMLIAVFCAAINVCAAGETAAFLERAVTSAAQLDAHLSSYGFKAGTSWNSIAVKNLSGLSFKNGWADYLAFNKAVKGDVIGSAEAYKRISVAEADALRATSAAIEPLAQTRSLLSTQMSLNAARLRAFGAEAEALALKFDAAALNLGAPKAALKPIGSAQLFQIRQLLSHMYKFTDEVIDLELELVAANSKMFNGKVNIAVADKTVRQLKSFERAVAARDAAAGFGARFSLKRISLPQVFNKNMLKRLGLLTLFVGAALGANADDLYDRALDNPALLLNQNENQAVVQAVAARFDADPKASDAKQAIKEIAAALEELNAQARAGAEQEVIQLSIEQEDVDRLKHYVNKRMPGGR